MPDRDPLARDTFGIFSDEPLEDRAFAHDTLGEWADAQITTSGGGGAGRRRRRLILPQIVGDIDEEAAIMVALFELGVL